MSEATATSAEDARQQWSAWVIVGLVLVGAVVTFLVEADAVRRAHHLGVVLQLGGAATIAFDLYELHYQAARDRTPLARLGRGFRGFWRNLKAALGLPHSAQGVGRTSLSGSLRVGGRASGELLSRRWVQDPSSLSDVERIERLEELVEDLRSMIRTERQARSDAVRAERNARAQAVKDAEQRLSDRIGAAEERLVGMLTSTLDLRWWGVAMLAAGLAVAGWAGATATIAGGLAALAVAAATHAATPWVAAGTLAVVLFLRLRWPTS